MISEAAQDLLTKIATVTALAASVGLTVGGKGDPAETKIPLPAAWVLFGSDVATDTEYGVVAAMQTVSAIFVVLIDVAYIGQADLITNQFPLLDAVRAKIHATTSPSGMRWRFEGQRLTLVNQDRLRYEQRYSVIAAV